MNYAYIDRFGFLTVLTNKGAEDDAKRWSANGKYEATGIEARSGKAVSNGKQITVRGVNECYTEDEAVDGSGRDTFKEFPELAALYERLS